MLGHSIVSQHFMEPERSIPNSQELSTCSYPEPDQSSPHHPIPRYILILSTHLRLGLPSGLSLSLAFPPIIYTHSFSPPFVLHTPHITNTNDFQELYPTFQTSQALDMHIDRCFRSYGISFFCLRCCFM
jgi:hypothetical protein